LFRADLRKKVFDVAPWALICILAVSNLVMIIQNIQMRQQLSKFRIDRLEKGDQVQPFTALTLSGETINVSYTGKETKRILLYFSAECPYCKEQFTYWREMMDKVNRNNYQIIGLVSDSEDVSKVREYLNSVGCQTLRVAIAPKDIRANYKLTMTPGTIIIDNSGKVEESWFGGWNEMTLASVATTLNIQFSQL
jgi:peroxiredoxin